MPDAPPPAAARPPVVPASAVSIPAPLAPPRRRARPLALAALPALLLAACTPGLKPMATGPAPVVPAAPPAGVERGEAPAEEGAYLESRRLMVPVEGVAPRVLRDADFLAPRDGGARTHRALDIMAPRGTPVLAADDGLVYRVRENALGGLTVYVLDPFERFIYYYAHLDRYRDGLREGMRLARGELLGYVGTTGNAPAHVPHLHFQAMRFRRDRYWDGEPVNPKPYLVLPGARAAVSAANDQP